VKRASAECPVCNKRVLILCKEKNINHILHLLLSVFTCGIWLIIWLLCAISNSTVQEDWYCSVCGTNLGEGDKIYSKKG